MTTRTVEVKIDETVHERAPRDETEALIWATLDTAYNLLRETAVRLTLIEIREQGAEQGVAVESDEELFRECRESGDPEAPTSYMDLAPDNELAARGLYAAFGLLVDQAYEDARQGLNGEY